MKRLRTAAGWAGLLASAITFAGPAGAATGPSTVRLDGIGPITLGMTRAQARRTGWLSDPQRSCPGRGTVGNGYRLQGARAPDGLGADVDFAGGTLRAISLQRGARTGSGVTVGVSTLARMASAYRAAGYQVTSHRSRQAPGHPQGADALGGGTYVTARRKGIIKVQGFGTGKVVQVLGLPFLPVCG